jgi:hypothetical protein
LRRWPPLPSLSSSLQLTARLRWIIFSSIVSFSILAFPAQIIEIYRHIYIDNYATYYASLMSTLVMASIIIFISCAIIVSAVGELPLDRSGVPILAVRLLLAVIAGLPLAGSILGHIKALPTLESLEQSVAVGNPWEFLSLEDLKSRLFFSIYVQAAVIAILTVFYMLFIPYTIRAFTRRFSILKFRYIVLKLLLKVVLFIIAIAAAVQLGLHPNESNPAFFMGIILLFSVLLLAMTTLISLLSEVHRLPYFYFVFLPPVLFSFMDINDNHFVSSAQGVALSKGNISRPDASQAFTRWLSTRSDLSKFKKEYPVYIVSAQGGGIYAAFQTGLFLARMQDVCPGFRNHLFAISSVSGGSVGAAAFLTALENVEVTSGDEPCPAIASFLQGRSLEEDPSNFNEGQIERRVRVLLSQDLLGPLVNSALFSDFLQRFLPFPVAFLDRSRAFERALEAGGARLSAPSASAMEASYLDHWKGGDRTAPILEVAVALSSRHSLCKRQHISPVTFFSIHFGQILQILERRMGLAFMHQK